MFKGKKATADPHIKYKHIYRFQKGSKFHPLANFSSVLFVNMVRTERRVICLFPAYHTRLLRERWIINDKPSNSSTESMRGGYQGGLCNPSTTGADPLIMCEVNIPVDSWADSVTPQPLALIP